MICKLCGEDKLSKEFPHAHLIEECSEHPLLHCLRCVTNAIKNNSKCSQCGIDVGEDNIQYKKYVATLGFLFPAVEADEGVYESVDDSTSHVVITTLSGERTTLIYDPEQTIMSVKDVVEKDLKTPFSNQCLLFNEIELKLKGQDDQLLKIKDYEIPPNSTIYLLVLLYAIPENFDNVVFDLFWGYPEGKKDYLDASVFLYSDTEFVEVVDYNDRASKSCSAVQHSGDVMDNIKRLGHHTINVSIKSIPAQINKLVFTLSAWNSPNISKYPNPSLKFFELKFPDRQLCSDEMSHAAHSQAIIMCSLTKRGGGWQVFSLKHLSAGNAMNYDPLKKKIANLIKQGYI